MTIRKGEQWGVATPRPDPLLIAGSDAELARWVGEDPNGNFGVKAGDVYRTVGAPMDREPMHRLPFDALRVALDDDPEVIAVAHVVAYRHWWRGPLVVVMNCDHIGEWNVAPRAHPNDGRFDVLEIDPRMSIRSRFVARRRLPQGTHVPHPDISVGVAAQSTWRFDRPAQVWIDGDGGRTCSTLSVEVLPDHFAIVV